MSTPRWSFSTGFGLFSSTKEKKLRDLRQQINALSNSKVLDEAAIDDGQILTLTREDLNELFPGVRNFNLRRTIMVLITETAKDSPVSGPETFDRALKHLMQKNSSNDATVLGILKESLQAFKETEQKLKAAHESIKPYIEILNNLIEQSARKQAWETEPHTSSRRKHSSSSQTNSNSVQNQSHSYIMKTVNEPPVRVNVHVNGRLFGAEKQVLAHLRGVEEGELQDCGLILVFYPIISRAGTDTEDVLRQIPANKPTVLVTMHHTFNSDYVCPSVNTRSSAANIVDHVNVLFHDSNNGILNCPANESAINKLQCIVNRYK